MKLLCTFFATIGLLTALSAGARADDAVLEADTMFAVDGPFLGNANPIRGVNGGGLPWVLDKAKVELDSDGELEVEVEGLIIPADAGFGFNPAPFFRAIVSCLSVDAGGNVVTANVMTTNEAEVMEGDPRNGDAKIEADVELPAPCVAPIVFVTSPGGSWFSATGLLSDDDDDSDSDSDLAVNSSKSAVMAESAIGAETTAAGATSLPFLLLLGMVAFLARRRATVMTIDN